MRRVAGYLRRRFTLSLEMWIAIGAAALAVIGSIVNAIATVRDRRRFPAPGSLIDVDGHRLHLHCLGDGRPAVIFECGAGDEASSWFEIQREVAKTTRACAYDRAGMGWSDAASGSRSAGDYTRELRTLLERGGVPAPFVIVAQSLGGLFALHFASEYPDDVAGLVLVDAGYKKTYETLASRNPKMAARIRRQMRLVPIAAFFLRLGLGRLIGRRIVTRESDVRAVQISHLQPKMVRALAAEGRVLGDLSSVRSAPPRNLPVIVLARGKTGEMRMRGIDPVEIDATWDELQRELAAMFDDGEHRVVDGAGHMIHLDRPDAVVEAIHDVVEAARTDREAV